MHFPHTSPPSSSVLSTRLEPRWALHTSSCAWDWSHSSLCSLCLPEALGSNGIKKHHCLLAFLRPPSERSLCSPSVKNPRDTFQRACDRVKQWALLCCYTQQLPRPAAKAAPGGESVNRTWLFSWTKLCSRMPAPFHGHLGGVELPISKERATKHSRSC